MDRRSKKERKNKNFKIVKKVPKSVRMLNKMNVLETNGIVRQFKTETEPTTYKKRCFTAVNKPIKRRNSFFNNNNAKE